MFQDPQTRDFNKSILEAEHANNDLTQWLSVRLGGSKSNHCYLIAESQKVAYENNWIELLNEREEKAAQVCLVRLICRQFEHIDSHGNKVQNWREQKQVSDLTCISQATTGNSYPNDNEYKNW